MKKSYLQLKDLNDAHTIQIDEDKDVRILALLRGKDSFKKHLSIVHELANTKSNVLIKAVLFDDSKLDLTANLVIKTGAKYSDGYLKIDVLLMSERANATAIPSLEITEESVKGGHGASISPLNPEHIFYLMSRGINEKIATQMLVRAFISEVLDPETQIAENILEE